VGVPEGAYTSTEEVVIRIGRAINIDIKPEDIEISHKLKRKTSKLVIVKFVSHKVKSLLYKSRTNLKNVKASDLFPSYAFAAEMTSVYSSTRILQIIQDKFSGKQTRRRKTT